MTRAAVDRTVGMSLMALTAVSVVVGGLAMGQGWSAVGLAAGIVIVGGAAGWSAERLGRHRARG